MVPQLTSERQKSTNGREPEDALLSQVSRRFLPDITEDDFFLIADFLFSKGMKVLT